MTRARVHVRAASSRPAAAAPALVLALVPCLLAGCGTQARTVSGLTYLDGQPRGLHTMKGRPGARTLDRGGVGFLGRVPGARVATADGGAAFMGRRPRGLGTDAPPGTVGGMGGSDGPSVARALAHGNVGGRSLAPAATVSSASPTPGFEAPERPPVASVEEARARAMSDLASSSPHYRYAGAVAAGALRVEAAVPFLARLARSDEAAAAPAIGALGVIGGEEAARALGAALARERQTPPRVRIIRALGVTRAKAALRPLLKALADDAALVRIEAAQALANLGDARAAPRLRAALSGGDSVEPVKVAVAAALARLGHAAGIDTLESALASGSPELGAMAIRGLASIALGAGGPGDDEGARMRMRAAEDIATALGSPYAPVWGEALRALARIRPADALRVLDALGNAAPEVRLRARVAKAAFGGAGSREVLEEALVHPGFELRAAAAEILGLLGDPAAVAALERSLEDPHGSVRVASAWALGVIADPAAAGALERAAARDDRTLRGTCAWALSEIRTRNGGAAARTRPERADRPSSTNGLELKKVLTGAGGRYFCVICEPGGRVVLLATGEETPAGYRVQRIVPGERGGGTVFLSKGDEALTLRAAPGPATSEETAAP